MTNDSAYVDARYPLSALTGRFDLQSESRTLFDAVTHVASSLAAVFAGERKALALPEF